MLYRTRVLAAAFVAGTVVFSGAAFGQSIEGVVRGPDGKALKDAEVRLAQKGNKNVVTTKTDARGHYSYAKLSPGLYKVSVILDGAEKSSVNVKTATTNSRIDFDLKPVAGKKVRHYVWADAPTGSHIGGGWVEVNDADNAVPGTLNSQTSSGELAREMQRRSTNPSGHN